MLANIGHAIVNRLPGEDSSYPDRGQLTSDRPRHS
jgi:hypothetical protein